jgi:hypothetical protein
MSAGNPGATPNNSPPSDPPQLASPEKLPAMDQNAKSSGGQSDITKGTKDCPLKKSWFAIRVVHQPTADGGEEVVDGLTLNLKLSCSGPNTQVTAKAVEKNQIDNLSPGGTGNVESTDHSEIVWEVETDIT